MIAWFQFIKNHNDLSNTRRGGSTPGVGNVFWLVRSTAWTLHDAAWTLHAAYWIGRYDQKRLLYICFVKTTGRRIISGLQALIVWSCLHLTVHYWPLNFQGCCCSDDTTSSPIYFANIFRKILKTHLFRQSYRDIVLYKWTYCLNAHSGFKVALLLW